MFSTEHFRMAEFLHSDTAARLGISNMPTPEHEKNIRRTMGYMEVVRTYGHGPVIVTSGYRSRALNHAIYGDDRDSDHSLGHACDFYFKKWPTHFAAPEVATALAGHPDQVPWDQFILESDRGIMHISFHPRARRLIKTQLGGLKGKLIDGIHTREP